MEIFAIFSGIVNFILLIVFLVMASNVSGIKTMLKKEFKESNPKYIDIYNAGKVKEYLGKNPEALDLYSEAYYLVVLAIEQYPKSTGLLQHKETIAGRIKRIGGVVKELTN